LTTQILNVTIFWYSLFWLIYFLFSSYIDSCVWCIFIWFLRWCWICDVRITLLFCLVFLNFIISNFSCRVLIFCRVSYFFNLLPFLCAWLILIAVWLTYLSLLTGINTCERWFRKTYENTLWHAFKLFSPYLISFPS
jgi:hypothetical protein